MNFTVGMQYLLHVVVDVVIVLLFLVANNYMPCEESPQGDTRSRSGRLKVKYKYIKKKN